MFGHDDEKPNNEPEVTRPTISGAPMSGVKDAADESSPLASPNPAPSLGGHAAGPPSVASPPSTSTHDSGITPPAHDDLADIKQKALAQLSPLVDKLDQTPEEKFRLTMTMIQASDDQALLKTAYEVAEKITDEKAKAEALLAIVNEVNYFSQKTTQKDKPSEESTAL